MKRHAKRTLLLVPLVLLLLAGCAAKNPLPAQPPGNTFDQTARDSIAAFNGYITRALSQRPECRLPGSTGTQCSIIHRGATALNVSIDALELYCGGVTFSQNSECNPLGDGSADQFALKLRDAIRDMERNTNDVRALAGRGN